MYINTKKEIISTNNNKKIKNYFILTYKLKLTAIYSI